MGAICAVADHCSTGSIKFFREYCACCRYVGVQFLARPDHFQEFGQNRLKDIDELFMKMLMFVEFGKKTG